MPPWQARDAIFFRHAAMQQLEGILHDAERAVRQLQRGLRVLRVGLEPIA